MTPVNPMSLNAKPRSADYASSDSLIDQRMESSSPGGCGQWCGFGVVLPGSSSKGLRPHTT